MRQHDIFKSNQIYLLNKYISIQINKYILIQINVPAPFLQIKSNQIYLINFQIKSYETVTETNVKSNQTGNLKADFKSNQIKSGNSRTHFKSNQIIVPIEIFHTKSNQSIHF